jgi:hypothetical protein
MDKPHSVPSSAGYVSSISNVCLALGWEAPFLIAEWSTPSQRALCCSGRLRKKHANANRLPRATRTRSPDALGLGQTINAGVQPRLNPMPALWRATGNRSRDPTAPSDRQYPDHLGLDMLRRAPRASAQANDDLKRQE